MRRHPAVGMALLEGVRSLPAGVRQIVGHHHERPDGRGYPAGLRGREIPLLARIVAVADCYDAMRSERPYRRPLSPEEAWAELRRQAGTQFDELVVAAVIRAAPAIESSLYREEPVFAACAVKDTPAPGAAATPAPPGTAPPPAEAAVPAAPPPPANDPCPASTSGLPRTQK